MSQQNRNKVAYIALGSNVGNRMENIKLAIDLLTSRVGRLVDTSYLYETPPMYVENQGKFLNAVVAIELPSDMLENPHKLFEVTFAIELEMGRGEERLINIPLGPRSIDIDLLLFEHGQPVVNLPDLIIPHLMIDERDFVLQPLCDVLASIGDADQFKIYKHYLSKLERKDCLPVFPIGIQKSKITTTFPLGSNAKRTLIMGILNVTPDSFSDGGLFYTESSALDQARRMISDGADIIDIGGESSRPGAVPISASEEQERVIPIIEKIRSEVCSEICISIDTYRADTAEMAIKAGANFINDISAASRDEKMLETAARLGVPIVLMHSRMNDDSHQMDVHETDLNGVFEVYNYLSSRIAAAVNAGIPRWNIILDVGFGFSKSGDDNFSLLKNLKQALPINHVSLAGPSRKRFVRGGTSWQGSSWDAAWGTSAAIVACIQQGSEIVRVHDVNEMKMVCNVADRIYRS